MNGLKVLVVHLKALYQKDEEIREKVNDWLKLYENKLGVGFLFPKAGDAFEI
jgi:cAMP phosphodiesterase